MHDMGQLWLRAEVRDLESRVRHRGATFSPYLAVDSDALIHHIHLVKQLVGAHKFIILIPSIGTYVILTSDIFIVQLSKRHSLCTICVYEYVDFYVCNVHRLNVITAVGKCVSLAFKVLNLS
jgi:hypothetical protein